jgi:hypothetical protein
MADWPSFSALDHQLKSTEAESRWGGLTQGNYVSRLVLLNLVLVCGNSLRNASLPQG